MKRILYIEDSVTSQRIFQRMFHPPHDVVIATSPRAGNEFLRHSRVDLIVCDFMFPLGDAFDVLTPLRQKHSLLELPLVAVSGSMDQALTARLLAAGANACVAKPFHNADFRALVEGMLNQAFVESDHSTVVSACCFQWVERGHYHEYCPETGDHLTGTDRAQLSDRMQALLQERWTRGALSGQISQERIRTYVLRHGAGHA